MLSALKSDFREVMAEASTLSRWVVLPLLKKDNDEGDGDGGDDDEDTMLRSLKSDFCEVLSTVRAEASAILASCMAHPQLIQGGDQVSEGGGRAAQCPDKGSGGSEINGKTPDVVEAPIIVVDPRTKPPMDAITFRKDSGTWSMNSEEFSEAKFTSREVEDEDFMEEIF